MRTTSSLAQRGVGLLEVLISVLVLSLGLLGAAALQTQALRTSADAQYFQRATLLANDYLERIRANSSNVTEYALASQKPLCSTPTLSGSVSAQDKQLWLQQIACQLPDGQAEVKVQGQQVQILINWFDRAESEKSAARSKQFQISSQL